ncbi:hypothetical protein BV898_17658 [Hypsibius exemplaris]|nr:hypothetical protein BV898_17658 [Hypsibius exemplaris]
MSKAVVFACLLMILGFALVAEACDCDYHSGGCTISRPAAAGNNCKCIYKGAWTCRGIEVGCSSGWPCEQSTSRSACLAGGGDCGGY